MRSDRAAPRALRARGHLLAMLVLVLGGLPAFPPARAAAGEETLPGAEARDLPGTYAGREPAWWIERLDDQEQGVIARSALIALGADAVPPIVAALEAAPTPTRRVALLRVLLHARREAPHLALATLRALLASGDRTTVSLTLDLLRRARDVSADLAPELGRLVDAGSGEGQRAARLLAAMGPEARSAVPSIVSWLERARGAARIEGAKALARLEPGHPALVAVRELLLASDDTSERLAGLDLHGAGFEDDAVLARQVEPLLKDASPEVRLRALTVRGAMRVEEDVLRSALVDAFDDADARVRAAACGSVARDAARAAWAVPYLCERLAQPAGEEDEAALLRALVVAGAEAGPAVPLLAEWAPIRPAAAAALAHVLALVRPADVGGWIAGLEGGPAHVLVAALPRRGAVPAWIARDEDRVRWLEMLVRAWAVPDMPASAQAALAQALTAGLAAGAAGTPPAAQAPPLLMALAGVCRAGEPALRARCASLLESARVVGPAAAELLRAGTPDEAALVADLVEGLARGGGAEGATSLRLLASDDITVRARVLHLLLTDPLVGVDDRFAHTLYRGSPAPGPRLGALLRSLGSTPAMRARLAGALAHLLPTLTEAERGALALHDGALDVLGPEAAVAVLALVDAESTTRPLHDLVHLGAWMARHPGAVEEELAARIEVGLTPSALLAAELLAGRGVRHLQATTSLTPDGLARFAHTALFLKEASSRTRALAILRHLGAAARALFPEVLAWHVIARGRADAGALAAVVSLAPDDPRALARVLEVFADRANPERAQVPAILRALGEPARQALVDLVQDPADPVLTVWLQALRGPPSWIALVGERLLAWRDAGALPASAAGMILGLLREAGQDVR